VCGATRAQREVALQRHWEIDEAEEHDPLGLILLARAAGGVVDGVQARPALTVRHGTLGL
jgi:hypothetical protein